MTILDQYNPSLMLAKFYLGLITRLGRSKLVKLNKVQAVLSQICDYSPVSVNAVLELAKLVRLVSLNKVQAVLSQICDYSPIGSIASS